MNRKKLLILIIILTAIIIFLTISVNKGIRYKKLSVGENEWNTIISAREENNNLVLKDISFNDYSLIIDEKNNTIYYSLINESKNKYNPNVSFEATENAKIAILLDEITDEKVKNNYNFKIMIYDDKSYHIYNLKCTGLPMLNITFDNIDAEENGKKVDAQIFLFNNLWHIPNRVLISDGRFKKNENNYSFSLNMLTPGKNVRDNKRSLLNLKPNSEYILNPVNNEIESYENDNKMDKETRLELFINNEYQGAYELDHIQEREKRPPNER